jgi:hypothetical protein
MPDPPAQDRKLGTFVIRLRARSRSKYQVLVFYEDQAIVVVPLRSARRIFPWVWLFGLGMLVRTGIVDRQRVEESAPLQRLDREALLAFPGAYTMSLSRMTAVELDKKWYWLDRTDIRFLREDGDVVWGSILAISRDDVAPILERALRAKFINLT